MTITSQDRKAAETKMNPFGAQDDLTADLPNVLQNMLHEFSGRNEVPKDITISERRARKICDHRNIGSYTLEIDSRLTSELSDFHFEARYEDDLAIDRLSDIVDDDNCSLPIVQLATGYFDHCVGYSAQPDSEGGSKDIYVIVMKVNHDDVLIYDPYRFRNTDGQRMKPTTLPKKDFISAWLGKWEITSTLWVEGTEQRRITQFDDE